MSTVFDPLRFAWACGQVWADGASSADGLAHRVEVRLQQLVSAARTGSALYRDKLSAWSGARLRLDQLPTTTRAELMARFDDWVTDPSLSLRGLRPWLKDRDRIGEPWLGRYLVWESSGTSRQAGIFVQDAAALAVYDALEWLRRHPPTPRRGWLDPWYAGDRLAFVGAIDGHFASEVMMRRLARISPWLSGRVHHLSILTPLNRLLVQLNCLRPTVIVTYPSMATLLAAPATAAMLDFRPSEIWTGGEGLSRAMRQRIVDSLGCAVRNHYGASEFLPIAWECLDGHLHVNADWVLLEPIDASGRPCRPGDLSATTLLTNLANRVQPLIRYDLGDQVRMVPGACDCGSPLPRIEVLGRRDEPICMEGRHGQAVTLLPLALTTVLEEKAGVFDFQLIRLSARSVCLRLPPSEQGGEAMALRCRHVLQQFWEQQGLAPLVLHIERMPESPRSGGGKARRVVSA